MYMALRIQSQPNFPVPLRTGRLQPFGACTPYFQLTVICMLFILASYPRDAESFELVYRKEEVPSGCATLGEGTRTGRSAP